MNDQRPEYDYNQTRSDIAAQQYIDSVLKADKQISRSSSDLAGSSANAANKLREFGKLLVEIANSVRTKNDADEEQISLTEKNSEAVKKSSDTIEGYTNAIKRSINANQSQEKAAKALAASVRSEAQSLTQISDVVDMITNKAHAMEIAGEGGSGGGNGGNDNRGFGYGFGEMANSIWNYTIGSVKEVMAYAIDRLIFEVKNQYKQFAEFQGRVGGTAEGENAIDALMRYQAHTYRLGLTDHKVVADLHNKFRETTNAVGGLSNAIDIATVTSRRLMSDFGQDANRSTEFTFKMMKDMVDKGFNPTSEALHDYTIGIKSLQRYTNGNIEQARELFNSLMSMGGMTREMSMIDRGDRNTFNLKMLASIKDLASKGLSEEAIARIIEKRNSANQLQGFDKYTQSIKEAAALANTGISEAQQYIDALRQSGGNTMAANVVDKRDRMIQSFLEQYAPLSIAARDGNVEAFRRLATMEEMFRNMGVWDDIAKDLELQNLSRNVDQEAISKLIDTKDDKFSQAQTEAQIVTNIATGVKDGTSSLGLLLQEGRQSLVDELKHISSAIDNLHGTTKDMQGKYLIDSMKGNENIQSILENISRFGGNEVPNLESINRHLRINEEDSTIWNNILGVGKSVIGATSTAITDLYNWFTEDKKKEEISQFSAPISKPLVSFQELGYIPQQSPKFGSVNQRIETVEVQKKDENRKNSEKYQAEQLQLLADIRDTASSIREGIDSNSTEQTGLNIKSNTDRLLEQVVEKLDTLAQNIKEPVKQSKGPYLFMANPNAGKVSAPFNYKQTV